MDGSIIMNIVERTGQIVALLRLTPEKSIEGRKKFHKLIYLLQEKGIDFGQDFIFSHYGVFSPSLANDLSVANSHNIISEDMGSDGNGYELKLNDGSAFGGNIAFNESETKIVSNFISKKPGFLEVLSTIVYLDDLGYEKEGLKNKLTEIKGHLSNYFTDAYKEASTQFSIGVG